MSGLFKRSFLPIVLFVIGAIFISLWFQHKQTEGFGDVYSNNLDAPIIRSDPYKPSSILPEESNSPPFDITQMPSSTSASNPAAPDCNSMYYFDMYYVEWCGYCKQALPEFLSLGSTMTIAGKTVVCTAYEYEKYKKEHDKTDLFGSEGKVNWFGDDKWKNFRGNSTLNPILGYPTLRLYDTSGKMISEYDGARQADAMKDWLKAKIVASSKPTGRIPGCGAPLASSAPSS